MDWVYLRSELQRIVVYVILGLAAKGGYHLLPGQSVVVMPSPPPVVMPVVPPPAPPAMPLPRVDPEGSVVRIPGCTATVIGPSPKPGYQFVLSAAHCTRPRQLLKVTHLRSGRVYDGFVYRHDSSRDLALIVLKTPDLLDYAAVALTPPAEGTRVWHRGHGVDRPGNREDGVVIRSGADGSFCRLQISVSSGDSGSGFFRSDTGELVATCYGTDGRWTVGPGVIAIRRFLQDAAG